MILAHVRRMRGSRHGIAAVEFALLTPVFLLLCVSMLDIVFAFSLKMRIANATTAAAAYALANGRSLTASTLSGFQTDLSSIVTGSISTTPTVTVLYNNSSSSANIGNFYCLSGYPATWTLAASASTSCGSNVLAGQFITITVTATYSPLFLNDSLMTGLTSITDTAIVRVQ